MILKLFIRSIQRKILEKRGSEQKIRYWRRHGMKIGTNCHFETMAFSTEPYLIEIGDHVAIAYGTNFITHDGGIWCLRREIVNGDIFGKIKIGNNVFIGMNSIILPNTIIGDNCIVGAGSVVRGKFPDNSVIIGNPAKIFTSMSVQALLYRLNPGLMTTNNLSDWQKEGIIREHFGISKKNIQKRNV